MQGLDFSLREVGDLIQLRERKVDACESAREKRSWLASDAHPLLN
jgi:hypothetical protein